MLQKIYLPLFFPYLQALELVLWSKPFYVWLQNWNAISWTPLSLATSEATGLLHINSYTVDIAQLDATFKHTHTGTRVSDCHMLPKAAFKSQHQCEGWWKQERSRCPWFAANKRWKNMLTLFQTDRVTSPVSCMFITAAFRNMQWCKVFMCVAVYTKADLFCFSRASLHAQDESQIVCVCTQFSKCFVKTDQKKLVRGFYKKKLPRKIRNLQINGWEIGNNRAGEIGRNVVGARRGKDVGKMEEIKEKENRLSGMASFLRWCHDSYDQLCFVCVRTVNCFSPATGNRWLTIVQEQT